MSLPGSDGRQKREDSLTDGGFLSPGKGSPGIAEVASKEGQSGELDTVAPPDNVVPIGEPDLALQKSLDAVLGPLGQEAANLLCDDMVAWSDLKPMEALSDLVCKAGIYGSHNLMRAWQSVRVRRGVKNRAAYFTSTLNKMLEEHGKRDLPPIKQQPEQYTAEEYRRVVLGRDGM